jgi:hypothetical protein
MEILTKEILIIENNEMATEFTYHMRKKSSRGMNIMGIGGRICVKIKMVNVFIIMKDTTLETGSRIKDMD